MESIGFTLLIILGWIGLSIAPNIRKIAESLKRIADSLDDESEEEADA